MPATDIVRRFKQVRALVIGDAMLDSYIEGTASRLCSEGPVPVVRTLREQHVPGGAANAAANLRAMGAHVVFLGIVGQDHAASLLRDTLQRVDVPDSWLVADPCVSTLHKQRVIADGQYVVRVDDGDTRACSPETRHRLLDYLDAVISNCDVVLVSDYAYGVVSDEMIERLRALCREHHCSLVVDSKQLQRFARAGATIVTPNHIEARSIVEGGPPGHSQASIADIERVGRRLLEMIDSECAAVTMAADGVLLLDRSGNVEHIPAHPVASPADVGAGDSFAAAMALALGTGAEGVEAARIGIDAAGIAVSKPRTAIVRHQELLQRVSLRDLGGNVVGELSSIAMLATKLMADRLSGKRIIFTNGVFDILHAGHVQFLRQAKALGDVLVVGVNSDAGASALKGTRRPINSERDRLALISALDSVDHAILFNESTPAELIRTLQPHVHVKGGDYHDTSLPEEEAVRDVGGEVVILPLAGAQSTSAIIDRIISLATQDGVEALHD